MRILYVPDFMSDVHWLIMATIFWGLCTYCWALTWETVNIRSLAYGILFTSLALIASLFWLIQSGTGEFDAATLFIIERAAWWPAALSAAVLVDIHAADFNGHRSLLARFHLYACKRNERLCK